MDLYFGKADLGQLERRGVVRGHIIERNNESLARPLFEKSFFFTFGFLEFQRKRTKSLVYCTVWPQLSLCNLCCRLLGLF